MNTSPDLESPESGEILLMIGLTVFNAIGIHKTSKIVSTIPVCLTIKISYNSIAFLIIYSRVTVYEAFTFC